MNLSGMVWRNLARRPARSLLTATGIGLAIAFAVSTIGVTQGFRKTFVDGYASLGTQMIVSKVSRDSPLPKPFDQSIGESIAEMPHVEAVSGMYWDLMSIEGAASRVVFGWERESFRWKFLPITSGRIVPDRPDVAYVGILAAAALGKKPGDTMEIESRQFLVAGIFEKNSPIDNSAVILPLDAMQDILDQPGKINFLNIRLRPETTSREFELLRTKIQSRFRGLRACRADELFSESLGAQAAMAMSIGVTFFALCIGTLGVMNSVLMSVTERKSEIGLLMAVGWGRRRVLRMILAESLFLSLLGAVGGVLTAIPGVYLLANFGPLSGKIVGDFPVPLIVAAIAGATLFGLIGGIIPALRAVSPAPSTALRHEI